LWNGLNLHYSTKFYRLRFDVPRLVHSLVLGAILVAAAQLLPGGLSPFLLWPLKAVLAAAYPLLLIVTGFLRPDEWETVKEMVSAKWRASSQGARSVPAHSLATHHSPLATLED